MTRYFKMFIARTIGFVVGFYAEKMIARDIKSISRNEKGKWVADIDD